MLVAGTFLTVFAAIWLFIHYHRQIFQYVTAMNTIRATDGTGNPELTTEAPV